MSTDLHHCMFGSTRRKLTKLIHNIYHFHQLHKLYDNQHEHEPWRQKPDGSWATSEETAYPWPLARSIAAKLVLQLQSQGIVCHLPSFVEQEATFNPANISLRLCQNSKKWSKTHSSNARVLSTPKRGYIASAKEVKEGQVIVGYISPPKSLPQKQSD